MSLRTLTELADKQIARGIQTVNGVGEVSLTGGRAREIHIVVDIEKLNSYGLSLTQVREAVVSENVEIPGGTIEQGKGQLLLRTLGRVDASEDFNNIVIATKDGTPIRVADIGRAEDTLQRPTSAVWLGDTPAVMIDIRRAMGENTVAVIEGVRAALDRSSARCRQRVTVTVIRDDSRFIYASVASLEEHLDLRRAVRRHRRHVLHPEHPRGDHLGARHSGVDHRDVHADADHGVHAEQHDAARRLRSPSASSSTTRSSCSRTSSATSRRRTARRSRRRFRERARSRCRSWRRRCRWWSSSCPSPSWRATPSGSSARSAGRWRSPSWCRCSSASR